MAQVCFFCPEMHKKVYLKVLKDDEPYFPNEFVLSFQFLDGFTAKKLLTVLQVTLARGALVRFPKITYFIHVSVVCALFST